MEKEQGSEVKQLTKQKHPGRVAQGYKLASIMKQRKEELKNKKTQQETQQVTEQETSTTKSSYNIYGVAGLAIIAGIAYLAYLNKFSKKGADKIPEKKQPKNWME